MKESLGMIETIGMTPAIRAADMMVKCAYVTVLGFEKSGSGIVTVLIQGKLDSVQAALDIGALEAKNTGELVAVHIINNPDDGIGQLLPRDGTEGTP
ncbi:BMC domain-containing protein [Paenibacillus sp. MER TA 81-3]|uniref:BMC domain-containing protein n=1 Tax=Paenibacillus sp. MER TA 81-3 TaxID=2939573 RepID=UPI002040D514|nr:BMC domain-containing protein [Paenibacillus sp. MER TA 81-3]MCM3340081.1 BMC domain-containing protein [Paenibacillus sp. MER TA 81-3]